MIFGVGTDLCGIARFERMLAGDGDGIARRILAASELDEFARAKQPAHFLAKRFAAKEALGKALGTGIRAPVLLRSIAVTHDDLGKPAFAYDNTLTAWMSARGLHAHLSLSDETEYALAFVVVERTENIT
ncbi:Holo-acyl-carrier-protein synthase [Methyloversatilis universalis FAM5]|uniref:Holo-[acyl-carrier-protein] synthase n=1 Tax=Methyloversatilis universalis (strain ATCC BAA-1314 / DSM 25237 / JCM 13912 / CCUG 52030 / FAM5) TaxID=1000565 RepID=F5R8S2_METUF|nr:holo-ACP synthase [Methyloversatilis universalis]EGK72812.1 Holo-acyl-carrier-protein synthase [Methyloversatilis universalis FAM5]